jgi:hypothetical protein
MLVFFWQGWGLLVPAIFFVIGIAINLSTNAITGSSTYWDTHRWPLGLVFIFSGICSWYLCKFLTRRKKVSTLMDGKTGKVLVVESRDEFFFIPYASGVRF